MSNSDIENIRKNGLSFRMPAGYFSKYDPEAAERLIGTTTKMDAKVFGYSESWIMKIVDAKVIEDGSSMELRLIPVDEGV